MKLLETATISLVLALAMPATTASAGTDVDTSLDNEVERYLVRNPGKWGEPDTLRAYWKSGLKFESGDGDFKLSIGGRLMFDVDFRNAKDFDGSEEAQELGNNNVYFRRVRLKMSGTVYRNTIFKVQLEFAKREVALKDAFVGLKNVGGGTIVLGHQKVPFGLSELISSKYISFLERAAPSNTFALDRDTGVVWGRNFLRSKRIWFRMGLLQWDRDMGAQSGDGGWGFAFRLTGLAIENKDAGVILNLGFSLRWQNLRASDGQVRYRARPETGTGPRTIDTGNIDARDDLRWSFELAFRVKSVHFQAEFFSATPNVDTGSDPTFTGWYCQIGWFVTGEERNWEQTRNGSWGRTRPTSDFRAGGGGRGALEFAIRFDQTDLTDSGITGGEQDAFTVGINWYWNPNARVMINYIHADITDGRSGTGKLNIVSIRWQFDF